VPPIEDPVANAEALMRRLGWEMPTEPPPRRPMDLPRDLPLSERQSLGGRHGSASYRARTDEKIATALDELRRDGARITQTALAARAGVSLNTVASRWRALAPKLVPPGMTISSSHR
jgi:hypothetical protein